MDNPRGSLWLIYSARGCMYMQLRAGELLDPCPFYAARTRPVHLCARVSSRCLHPCAGALLVSELTVGGVHAHLATQPTRL
jgi:hypothetical protein